MGTVEARPIRATYSDVPRIRPLVADPDRFGVNIDWDISSSSGKVVSHIEDNDYDLFEYSICGYITAIASGLADRLGWTALPIFLSRPLGMFENFIVGANSGITSLRDFDGKRIGIPEYRMTAGVWLRAMLRDMAGVAASRIKWVNGIPMDESYISKLGGSSALPKDIDIRQGVAAEHATLVLEGAIDGAFASAGEYDVADERVSRPFAPASAVALFADMAARMGCTPANHVAVVKRSVLEQEPGVAGRLYRAFEDSKQESYDHARRSAEAYLWQPAVEFDHQARLFGDDPYPSGVRANWKTLDILMDQMRGDGQLSSELSASDLFAADLLDT